MSMVHDNIILSYQVDFEANIMTLKTRYDNGDICENTDVVFTDYLTHMFEHVLKGSTIFDITECQINLFVKRESELLKKNKNYGWPIFYETRYGLIKFLKTHGYKIFEISSSDGLNGYVFAKQLSITTVES